MKMHIVNFILFTALFYFTYMALFRNKSFFNLNRWLILSFPILSLGIVFIAPQFNDPIYQNTGFTTTLLPEIVINATSESSVSAQPNNYWWVIYCTGMLLSLLLFVRGIWQITKLVKDSEKVKWNNLEFGLSQKAESPFSFFNHIILPYSLKENKDLNTILTHEQVHRSQKHSSDNLYYNLLSILFWFNPFIHLLGKELRQTHECIADKKAIENTSREVYAHMLLSSTFGKEVALPANPFFNSSLLKTRITMLYKNESPKWLKYSYLAILPLAIAMTLHACNKAPEDVVVKGEKVQKAAPINFEQIESPPLFENCDENASVEEQKNCFKKGIFNYIVQNLKYPQEAYEMGLEGIVYVGFVIDENGEITDVEVKRGISVPEDANNAEKEAANAMTAYAATLIESMPKLKSPAKYKGKFASLEFTLPISYKLK